MENILVTGAGGFLGARLIEMLEKRYRGKNQLVLLTSREIDGYKCVLHKNYSYAIEDFTTKGITHIDKVIHAGWFVAKTPGEKEDMDLNFSPLINTYYLLSHLPNIPKKIVFCSSTDVYGGTGSDQNYIPGGGNIIDENSPIELVTLYGLSKYCAELFVQEWAEQHKTDCQILRLGPLYGIGDKRENFFIGAMLKQAARGENLSLYADVQMKRNFLYVDDCCEFIIKGLELTETPGVINVVSQNNPSMQELVDTICEVADEPIHYDVEKISYKGKDLAYDASKRILYLGKEGYTLKNGLRAGYLWNKDFYFNTADE